MPVFNNALAGAAGSGGADAYTIKRSLRFNKDDGAYLSRNFATGNRKTWTWSGWVKLGRLQTDRYTLFECTSNFASSGNPYGLLNFAASGVLGFGEAAGGAYTTAQFRDHSAWYHVVAAMDTTQSTPADRLKLYVNGVQYAHSGYTFGLNADTAINQSAQHNIGREENSDIFLADYLLADVHFIDGQALDCTSFGEFDDLGVWQPKAFTGSHNVGAGAANGFHLDFSDNSSNAALGYDAAGSNNWAVNGILVSSILNYGNAYNGSLNGYMPSGVAQATDPSQLASTSNRTHFFLVNQDNSINLTVVATATSMTVGSSVYDGWGSNNPTTTLDNGTVTPNSSGTDTSVSGKNLATNTFTGLTIGNTYTISTKNGGAGNPHRVHYVTGATVQNKPVIDTDSLLDSPTNYDDGTNIGGNFAAWNPLTKKGVVNTTNGNFEATATNNGTGYILSTLPMSSGKFYCEISFEGTMAMQSNYSYLGIVPTDAASAHSGSDIFRANGALSLDSTASAIRGTLGTGGGETSTYITSSDSFNENDVIGIAIDCDTPQVTYYKNGVSIGTFPHAMQVNKSWVVFVNDWAGAPDTEKYILNAGQRDFVFPPPTGFKSMCTTNLDDPPIAKSSDHFLVKAYNGNGGTQSISTGFSPDLVWLKSRDDGEHHGLFDTHRGPLMRLTSDYNYASTSRANTLTSFNSDGFSLGSSGDYNGASNESHIAWAWEGGDFNNTFNTSSYDQSQIWSEIATLSGGSTASGKQLIYGFDGTTSTRTEGDSNNEYLELPISATITSGGVRVFAAVTSSSPLYINLYNGSSNVETVTGSNSGGQWYATTYAGPITKIRIERSGRPFEFNAVEVNGKILVNSGIISVGSKNSTVYNTSQNWSTAGSNMQNNWNTSFDGKESPTFALPNTGYSASMTFPSPISYQTLDLIVSRDIYAPDLLMNGNALNVPATDTNTTSGQYVIETLRFTNGTLTSIGHNQRNTAGRGGSGFWKIIVDGKILVDTNQASGVDNVPSVPSTCRTNQTAGFSICSYGATGSNLSVAHGLNTTPSLILLKSTNATTDWLVMYDNTNPNKFLKLNDPQGETSASNVFREVSSSVFETGNDSGINSGTQNKIAYVFSEVKGYSKFGSYQSSGNTFVYTGFRPAFVIFKSKVSAHWVMMDVARDTYNAMENHLHPNLANGEATAANRCDFLSNGFTLRANYGETNDGQIYYYFAFAENPFKYARAR